MITNRDLIAIEAHMARVRRRRFRKAVAAALCSPAGLFITGVFFTLAVLS